MSDTRNLEAKNPALLLERISVEFPELSWRTYRFLNHGWDHEVVILDDRLVFRFPNSDEYLDLFKREAGLMAELGGRITAPIPRYTYLAADKSFGGYEMVPGLELTRVVFDELIASEREAVVKQLAVFLSELHSTPLSELMQYQVERDDWSEYGAELREGLMQQLRVKLTSEEYAAAEQILGETEEITASPLPEVLIHQDICDSHLIWNGQRLGVIDFSDRAIGDPARDFAELYLYGADTVAAIYDAYVGPKDGEFLRRAVVYQRLLGVDLLVDSFKTDKISYEEAKRYFDRVRQL